MNMKIKLKKGIAAIGTTSILATSFFSFNPIELQAAKNFDYNKALEYSIQFYDANKCGKEAGDNAFNWRKPCHVNDGKDVGLDLSGGFHDCGDYVKFGMTQNYAASVLGWSLYEYKDAFNKTGTKNQMMGTLKHFTDYLLKCHPNKNVFYYQVGDGNTDHAYWGAPENQGDRKVIYKVDAQNPGSDIAGGASAALSLMYLNYKDIDINYANRCLNAAKSLYELGKKNPGLSKGQTFYDSTSYFDDMAWAAVWLYRITNNKTYLNDAEEAIGWRTDGWTMCWNNMVTPATIELYKLTKNDKYLNLFKKNIDYWKNGIKTTAGGLKYLDEWGVLRYSSAEAMLALQYYELTGDKSAKDLAVSQINYILGDNPKNMSYMIGYGDNYPKYPHHRAANGYTYAGDGHLKPAKHILYGALVGGPDINDNYKDNATEYVYTEVGIDYNAGLVGALAGLISNEIGGSSGNDNNNNQGSSEVVKIEAEKFNEGKYVEITHCPEGGQKVSYINNWEYLIFNNIDFNNIKEISFRASSANQGGKIEIRTDGPQGELLGTCNISNTGNWNTFKDFKTAIKPTSGKKKLCLVFRGNNNYLFDINYIKLHKGSSNVELKNGNFENGTLSPWVPQWGNGKLELCVNNNCYKGKYAMKYSNLGSAKYDLLNLTPNTKYKVTCYSKAVNTNRATIGVKNHGQAEVSKAVIGDKYQKTEVTFTTGPNSKYAMLYIYNGENKGTVFADEFKIERVN